MTDVSAPATGEPARSFDLADLDGRTVRLDDLRGKAFLLIFLRHAG
jgi:peroxiredoxin